MKKDKKELERLNPDKISSELIQIYSKTQLKRQILYYFNEFYAEGFLDGERKAQQIIKEK